ncbi:Clp protease ClpP [Lysinibacillus sphaericus]|uniref:head maturation protease, ClpP-related n=1 Tax=Lysinibacillus sphaericus TaxID=1421 RepID=UPI00068F1147|nr:head maturation protease, ClpP-related [Lysinibacillus sphaericus]QTB24315.1 Clp protease ClpP [Lysinibacillus sphaericus]
MARIDIRGAIVPDGEQWIYDWYGIPAVSPKRIMQQIDRAINNQEKELVVNINSPGGSVYAASEIWTHIKKYPGNSVSEISGVCASAASIIALASKKVVIAPVGALMIHNASVIAEGDYREMESMKQLLIQTNDAIMQTYKEKTKKSEEELKQMMDAETWMNAQQAMENGFVDEIMFAEEMKIVASAQTDVGANGLLPKAVIDKMFNLRATDPNIVVKNSVSTGSPVTQPEAEGDDQKMDLQELQNKHPELVEQIRNTAKKEAVVEERKRIQDIENFAQPGMENIVNKAKFETGISAAETAVEILNAQKEQNKVQMKNRIEDAVELNNIAAEEAPKNNNENELEALVNKVMGTGVK